MALIAKGLLCSGCPLYGDPQIGEKIGFSHSEGSSALGILICGEALGENERTDALPFRPYAASGSILERAFRRIGIDREQVALTNLIRCRPPNNKLEGAWYEAQAVGQCSRYLREAIEKFRPRVIVALGNLPLKYLTGMVGRNRSISMLRGFVLNGAGVASGIPVVASFHPAFLARGARNLIGVLARDIQLAVELSARIAGGEEIKQDVGTYDINPSMAALSTYVTGLRIDDRRPISYDIETDELERDVTDESEAFGGRFGNITQIQFSWEPRQAVVCDWREPYIQFAKDIMALPNPKWGWNTWGYDDPRLEHYGVRINGESHDLMWAWHHLQPDIPRNLQFATSFYSPEMPAWKHTSSINLSEYGGADVDSVQRIGVRLFDDLQSAGVLAGYNRHIVALWPILKRMCQRGLPVNLEARAELRKKIEERSNEVYQTIQALIDPALKGIHPTLGYKVAPVELRRLAAQFEIQFAGKNRITTYTDDFKQRVFETTGLKCKEFEPGVERFYREKDFLPNSSDQLKVYLRFKGIPVPTKLRDKNEDGTAKETTEEKELERLFKKTQDPVIGGVREYRKLKKILSTYIDGWQVDGDGLVHSTFTFATATGQLSSRSPNIQNAPVHGELAKDFKKTLWARPGHTLVSIDWRSFHALTLGYCARDLSYMRLARLDIHSYLAGHILKLEGRDSWLPLPDDELAGILGEINSNYGDIRKKKAKPTCIAEGSLVLTNKGLVPIEAVSVDDLVWDGIEWVSHDGVIYHGEREIIEYEGLRATPDHRVYCSDGRIRAFEDACTKAMALDRTESQGREIRTSRSYFREDYQKREGVQISASKMSSMWSAARSQYGKLDLWTNFWLSSLLRLDSWIRQIQYPPIQRGQTQIAGESLRCYSSSLHYANESQLSSIWRSRNRMSLSIQSRIRKLGDRKSSSSYLSRSGDRQNQQRWTLRAGEFEIGNTDSIKFQQVSQYLSNLSWREILGKQVEGTIQSMYYCDSSQERINGGRNCRKGSAIYKDSQDRKTTRGYPEKVRVYDIVNAGPRHRFTVSGVLVSNCLGYGFGLGASKLYDMNIESFDSKKEAQAIIDLLNSLFPKTAAFREEVKEEASKNGLLRSPFGYLRRFQDVYSWSQVKDSYEPKWGEKLIKRGGKIYKRGSGDEGEAAIAWKPANFAYGHAKEVVLSCEEKGYLEKYRLVNFVHDELRFECPNELVDNCVADISAEMEARSKILIDPDVAPLGLACGVEASVGPNVAELKCVYKTDLEKVR